MKRARKLFNAVLSAAMAFALIVPQSPGVTFAQTEEETLTSEVYASAGTVSSKKGIQICSDILSDVEDLGVSESFINIVVQDVYSLTPTDYSYNYNGKTYYFTSKIEDYDSVIGKMTDAGINVTVALINRYRQGYEDMLYPGVSYREGTYDYAFNTATESGKNCVEAITRFLAARYNGSSSNGNVDRWVVGNEVNDNLQYNYIGEMEINQYVNEYYKTFKTIYDSVVSVNSDATVYIPLEHRWTTENTTKDYAGKDFLNIFNSLAKADGDFNWGVAFHAYSFPMNDPDILNDNQSTLESDGTYTYGTEVTTGADSPLITMYNINVLTDYMAASGMRDKNGNVRSVILSEQGYTSYSNIYGENQEKQAANIALAYYKAEMNPYIDAFILKGQADDINDGSAYYQFGLWTSDSSGKPVEKKLSYNVYKYIDTTDSLNVTAFALKTLGISSWSEAVPGFDASKFASMKSISTGSMYSATGANGGTVLSEGLDGYWEPGYYIHQISYWDHAGNSFPKGTEVADAGAYYLAYQAVNHSFTTKLDASSAPYLGFTIRFVARESSQANDSMVVRVRVHSGDNVYDTDCVVKVGTDNNLYVDLSSWAYRNSIDKVSVWVKEQSGTKSFDGVFTVYNFRTAQSLTGAAQLASTGTVTGQGSAYDDVFDAVYYFEHNPDVAAALNNDTAQALGHFISYGMAEGRQGNAQFNPSVYRSNYNDLEAAFGDDMTKYYMHYINNGKAEGRNAVSLLNAASYKGVDYSAVYSAEDYYALNSDVAAAFGNDASALIEHFVNYGMSEGRQAKQSFNVYAYKFYNSDVAGVYGDDTRGYYMHYIQYGVNEGRKATGSIFENVDYSAVFDFEYYAANNADVVNALGYSESALLKHFAQYGVNEGRRGNALFDVNIYKASNSDVAAAFGNNTREYYIHFINYGINEGRASSETGYKGVDYSAVYNRIYYLQNNEDVAAAFGDDAGKLIEHFVDYGMSEGRQASADFNVNNYKARYEDLRNAFGDNLAEYYRHYINNGLAEGRNGN